MKPYPCARHLIAALSVLCLVGCVRGLHPTDRTAVIKAGQWGKVYRGGYAEVAWIKGVEPSWRARSELEVQAGDVSTVLEVYLCQGGMSDCISIAQGQVTFRAEADRTYRVHAREEVNGSNRFYLWVEDERSGKTVGASADPGNKPPQ